MELSWIPHFLDRIDYTYTQRMQIPKWHRFKDDSLPSDYFHRNVFAGFQEDGLGIKMRDIIGVDNLMWGSDYPHVESTFPKESRDSGGDSGGLYWGGEGQNRRRECRQGVQGIEDK